MDASRAARSTFRRRAAARILLSFICALTGPLFFRCESVAAMPCITAQQIDTYLVSKGSPLAGHGAVFVQRGLENNVDPRLLVAIAGAETSFGKILCTPYNAWNWFWQAWCDSPFDSWDDGIYWVTRGLRLCYLNQGLTSIETIGSKYCPGCTNWVRNVTFFYGTELGGSLGDLTFSCCQVPGPPNLISPLTGPCSWFKHDARITLVVSPGSGSPTQYNYHIWCDGCPFGDRWTGWAATTQAGIEPLPPGTYHWTARARNSCGESGENPTPQTLFMNDPPDPPSPVSTATAYSRSLTVPLSWNPATGDSDGTQYGLAHRLSMARADGGWFTDTGFSLAGTRNSTNVTVPLEGRYTWAVAAGEGPWPDCRGGGWDTLGFGPEGSFIVDVRPAQYLNHGFSPPSPGRADSVTITASAADTNPDSTVTVSGVKTVTVLIDGQRVGVVPGPSGSVNWDTRSAVEGWHALTMIIADNAGNTASKTVSDAYLLDKTPPLPPPNVRGEGGPHLVDLEWDETTDAWTDVQGYNVYRALAAEGRYEKINSEPIPPYETSFRDDNNGLGLANVTRYWYKVTAVDTANPDGNENPLPSVSAVPITAGITGDITGDDLVDIQDVVRCIRIAVGRDWPTDGQADLADLNKDTLVDVADVILDIRKALGIVGSAQVRAGEPSMSDARTKPLVGIPWTSLRDVPPGLSDFPKQAGGVGSVFVPPVIRARAGSVATVPLYLRRVSGVAGIQVSVGLDQRFLRLVSVSKGELITNLPAWSLYVNPSGAQPSILATAGLSLQPISTGARSCILSLSLAVQGPSRKIGRVPITLRGKLVDERGELLAPFDCKTTILVF